MNKKKQQPKRKYNICVDLLIHRYVAVGAKLYLIFSACWFFVFFFSFFGAVAHFNRLGPNQPESYFRLLNIILDYFEWLNSTMWSNVERKMLFYGGRFRRNVCNYISFMGRKNINIVGLISVYFAYRIPII